MSDEKVIKLGRRGRRKSSDKSLIDQFHKDVTDKVYCNFCGRSEDEVLKMVKGPGVNICSECTMIAVQYLILKDKLLSSDAQKILDTFWGQSKH